MTDDPKPPSAPPYTGAVWTLDGWIVRASCEQCGATPAIRLNGRGGLRGKKCKACSEARTFGGLSCPACRGRGRYGGARCPGCGEQGTLRVQSEPSTRSCLHCGKPVKLKLTRARGIYGDGTPVAVYREHRDEHQATCAGGGQIAHAD